MLRTVILGFALLLAVFWAGCRTSDHGATVSLSDRRSAELISWLSGTPVPKAIGREHFGLPYEICDELLARREIDFIVTSFETMTNEDGRAILVSRVLYQIDDEKIAKAFAKHLDDRETEESYYVANYLAKRGNEGALAILNRHYFQYPISSWQWSYTVDLFGKYKYREASTNLVNSLAAASLNVSSAAVDSLHSLYPDSPSHFDSPDDAEDYYRKRLHLNKPDRTE